MSCIETKISEQSHKVHLPTDHISNFIIQYACGVIINQMLILDVKFIVYNIHYVDILQLSTDKDTSHASYRHAYKVHL